MSLYFEETGEAWLLLVMAAVVSAVLAFVYLVFLRCFAGLFIWTVILAFMACLGGTGYLFYSDHSALANDSVKDYVATDEDTKKIIAYVLWGILGVIFIFVLCMYSRIKLGIAIVKTGAMFVMNVKSTLFVPAFMCLMSAVLFAVYVIGFVYTYSSGDANVNDYGINNPDLSET